MFLARVRNLFRHPRVRAGILAAVILLLPGGFVFGAGLWIYRKAKRK